LRFSLSDDGSIPNNSRLPVLIYRAALDTSARDAAAQIERLIEANGWSDSWRNGIYPFHHYHSTAHEVLAIARGRANVQLGGENGIIERVDAGDVLVLPAGTGHKNLGSSADLLVIGAYPEDQEMDMCYGKPEERPKALQDIAKLTTPEMDPIYGSGGPLTRLWVRG